MSELTVHTGGQGDATTIHVDWFDHNNVRQRTDLVIAIQCQDKPRTLEVKINGVVLAVVPSVR